MATVDPRIAMGVQPVQLRDPLEQYGNVLAIQGAQQRNALMAQNMQQAAEDRALATKRREGLNALLSSGQQGEALEGALLKGGYVDEALKLGKDRREMLKLDSERKKADADTEAKALDTLIARGNQFAQALRGATDQASWLQTRDYLGQMFGPDRIASIPQQFDPQFVQTMLSRSVSELERLNLAREQAKATETARHNQRMEGIAAGNLAVNQQREARERNAPRGQVVTGEDGSIILVDPRNATSQPVLGPDGQPVRKAEKPAPAGVIDSLQMNVNSRRAVLSALESLKTPEGKNALGLKNMLPGAPGRAIVNYFDPEGTNTRADVSDIGSLQVKDRSGATVTIGEEPRLMGFIPTPTDSADVAQKKLQRLLQALESDFEIIGQSYPQAAQKAAGTLKRQTGGGGGSWESGSAPRPAGTQSVDDLLKKWGR